MTRMTDVLADRVSTIGNTQHSISGADIAVAAAVCKEAFIAFTVAAVKGIVAIPGLSVDERDLLFRTYFADLGGAMRPIARMMRCTDEAAERLPADMREVMS